MLAEERFNKILAIVDLKGSVTVQQLMSILDTSESTIRRDLNTMHSNGLLIKVHGGAISKNISGITNNKKVFDKQSLNTEEKIVIAKYAAQLIENSDFVYLDAGTTTELLVDFLETPGATFVTNSSVIAKKLSSKGYLVYILGGEYKAENDIIVGEEAVVTLDKYNFTKGFWGADGVSVSSGYTTTEIKIAMVKKKSMEKCKNRYVLADSSKFSQICSVKFSDFNQAKIITTELNNEKLSKISNVIDINNIINVDNSK